MCTTSTAYNLPLVEQPLNFRINPHDSFDLNELKIVKKENGLKILNSPYNT